MSYKLPRCWVGWTGHSAGKTGEVVLGSHTDNTEIITEKDCNPKCHCLHPMAAHFCMEGHMTECHAGMTCEEAECSHYSREEFYSDDEVP